MLSLQRSFPDSAALPDQLLDSHELIDTMIDLKLQLAHLEQQIQQLQPAFYAACAALNTDKIELERATISKRFTPGQWSYSADILQQDQLLKQLRRQFQLDHDPVSGREVIWVLKLLLGQLSGAENS